MSESNGETSPGMAIDIASVSKTFRGRVRALQNVSLQVGAGEVFGLLGPNGAGKSTLVKILMTVVRPSKCKGRLLYRPIGDKDMLRKVGYLPEHHRFPDYLTGAQVLDHFACLSGVTRRLRKKRTAMLLDLMDLTDWAKTEVKGYSKGMRQRLGIAQSLMNNPDLVLLDEPTNGVDPLGRRDIRKIIQRLKSQGTTIFINSHLLSELEMVCDRVAILVQGKVVKQGTIAELTAGQERFEIAMQAPNTMADQNSRIAQIIPAQLERLPGQANALEDSLTQEIRGGRPTHEGRMESGERVELRKGMLTIWTSDPVRIKPVLEALMQSEMMLERVQLIRPSLEELFLLAVRDPNTGKLIPTGAERGRRHSHVTVNGES